MRTDDVLDQIDACLGDYDISDDAMRYAPDIPKQPIIRPRANGSTVLIQRLTDRHGLSRQEAAAAVLAAERGQDNEHARLAATEAQAVMGEISAQFRAAFQPMVQHMTEQFAKINEAFRQVAEAVNSEIPGKPPRLRTRPAWQSPYGPAQRRR